ncbi:MAG: TetR/AcrR family transcriptional regulator [Oscillospiraceae bacterium]
MGTKETIINESLELFSVKGFEEVYMRDIAGKVGIRESSIYKHLKGKQSILDSIVMECKERIEQLFLELKVPNMNEMELGKYSEMSIEDISDLCCSMFFEQNNEHRIVMFRRLLIIEQYKNDELQKLYSDMFIENSLRYQKKVFEYLMKANILVDEDPEILAIEFFSPFFMFQYRYLDDIAEGKKQLKKHAEHFLNIHLKEEER